MKILKYNQNTLANNLIGRLPCSNRNINGKYSRKNGRFFFKPHIDFLPNLNKNRISFPVELDDNNTPLEICIWTITIHNKDDRKRRLRFAKNATDCNCHIDIMKDKKSSIDTELYIIDSLPGFKFIFNNNHIDSLIKKYCYELYENITIVNKITRNSFKELLFLVTARDLQYVYLLQKQNVPVFDEYSGSIIGYKNELNPKEILMGKYDINLVFNCNEKKDERGKKYNLDIKSWEDVKLN